MDYIIHQLDTNPWIIFLYSLESNEPNYVIKNSDKVSKEYEYYQIPHPAFKSFDTYYDIVQADTIVKLGSNELKGNKIYEFLSNTFTSILIGELNPNLITLFEYRAKCSNTVLLEQLINTYSHILALKDECFETFGFVHGDFKTNNILINPKNPQSIQFIDFEFSMRFSSPKSTQTLKSNDIVLYLCVPETFEITGEFGRLFDIYLFAIDLKVFYKFFNNFVLELEKIFANTDISLSPNGFIDFFLILQIIKLMPNSNLINISDNTLQIEFFTIKYSILNFRLNLNGVIESNYFLLKTRLGQLKSIIENIKQINQIN